MLSKNETTDKLSHLMLIVCELYAAMYFEVLYCSKIENIWIEYIETKFEGGARRCFEQFGFFYLVPFLAVLLFSLEGLWILRSQRLVVWSRRRLAARSAVLAFSGAPALRLPGIGGPRLAPVLCSEISILSSTRLFYGSRVNITCAVHVLSDCSYPLEENRCLLRLDLTGWFICSGLTIRTVSVVQVCV